MVDNVDCWLCHPRQQYTYHSYVAIFLIASFQTLAANAYCFAYFGMLNPKCSPCKVPARPNVQHCLSFCRHCQRDRMQTLRPSHAYLLFNQPSSLELLQVGPAFSKGNIWIIRASFYMPDTLSETQTNIVKGRVFIQHHL